MDSRAQAPATTASVTGRVTDAATREPITGALAAIEGTTLRTLSTDDGRYRLIGVPAGPQVVIVRRIGFAPARIPINVPATGSLERDVALARTALALQEIIVTADPTGRARGELGTASVMDRDAIANQTAASLAGILELTPGVQLTAPGLDGIQQATLRFAPTSGGGGLGGTSSAELAAFGTLIVLDGVPVSNNANLQTTGPRGELGVPSSAGGGVDLRRFPAATIERVEVIRGVPSARYGDLTNGAIVVDTRAGDVAPELAARYDVRTTQASLVGSRFFGGRRVATLTMDGAKTRLAPGLRDDVAHRTSGQLAFRAAFGSTRVGGEETEGRWLFDTRLDFFRLVADNPEQPDISPGFSNGNRETGFRLAERARLLLSGRSSLTWTFALDHTRQRSFVTGLRVRGALPFTDAVDEGRNTGRYVGGQYLSRVDLSGDPWLIYSRLEAETRRSLLGFGHTARAGLELRREWNAGAGYQFDIEFPPQVSFNGVQGYDRTRRFDAIPPVATSALYVDDRLTRTLWGGAALDLQVGLRYDRLHQGTNWLTGQRDAVFQPRLNGQLSPLPWLRLRAGAGTVTKTPSVGQLFPAPQYYDIINVNWFTNDPAERLAVLTTFIRDPTNPDLGFSRARKREAGFEVSLGRRGALSLVRFHDRITGGVSFRPILGYVTREIYTLSDSTIGTGVPPTILEPPERVDTIPEVVDEPANVLDSDSRGWEFTAALPEWRAIRTSLDVQAAVIETRVNKRAIEVGPGSRFSNFQLDERIARSPYWDGTTRTGQRTLITWRFVHHQPTLGLVVTLTVQHTLNEERRDIAGTDTLAFAGYVLRNGTLVPVPAEQRADTIYQDLHVSRSGFLTVPSDRPNDWLLSLQVAKTLPLDGQLRFYAFNALDRPGRFDASGIIGRPFTPVRFGLELTMPIPVATR